MKKNLIRLATSVLGMACVLSLAACGGMGGSPKAGNSSAAPASSAVSAADPTVSAVESSEASGSISGMVSSAAQNAAVTGKFASVEEFVNSDLIQSQLETLKSTAEESGTGIDITGEGDKLIYTFTYGDLGELDETAKSTMASALESALDAQADTFTGVAASLKAAVEVENPVVVVRYVTSDGEELYSQEFTPAE